MTEDPKFKVGDCVRVKVIGGPKMIVGAVAPPDVAAGWFNKHDEFVEFRFHEKMLERAPK